MGRAAVWKPEDVRSNPMHSRQRIFRCNLQCQNNMKLVFVNQCLELKSYTVIYGSRFACYKLFEIKSKVCQSVLMTWVSYSSWSVTSLWNALLLALTSRTCVMLLNFCLCLSYTYIIDNKYLQLTSGQDYNNCSCMDYKFYVPLWMISKHAYTLWRYNILYIVLQLFV